MAVTKTETRDQLKIEYKTAYDTSGALGLSAWSQTFSYVKESSTLDQQLAYVKALASLTIYAEAPYKTLQVETSELVVG